MICVEVVVTKIIDTAQPFWVECKMEDAYGEEHIFQDKMPIFLKNTWQKQTYRQMVNYDV